MGRRITYSKIPVFNHSKNQLGEKKGSTIFYFFVSSITCDLVPLQFEKLPWRSDTFRIKPATLLKVTPWVFSRFSNCTNRIKLRKASHIFLFQGFSGKKLRHLQAVRFSNKTYTVTILEINRSNHMLTYEKN